MDGPSLHVEHEGNTGITVPTGLDGVARRDVCPSYCPHLEQCIFGIDSEG